VRDVEPVGWRLVSAWDHDLGPFEGGFAKGLWSIQFAETTSFLF